MRSVIVPLVLGLSAPLPALASADGYVCGFFTVCSAADTCNDLDVITTLTPNNGGYYLEDKAGDFQAQLQVLAKGDGNLYLGDFSDPQRAVYVSVLNDGTAFITEHSYRGRAVLWSYYGQCETAL